MGFFLRILGRAVVAAAGGAAVVVLACSVVPPPTTAFMIRASIERGSLVDYDWVPASRISPDLLVAVVAAEDQRFASHSGFDWTEIRRAADQSNRGGRVRGASTISQQVAKNLFLWPGQSYLRKAIEAVLTAMIETVWTKRRILEVYVNVAEMGDGTFGAEAAAQRFFRKPAANLTAAEAALLAAVLPSPRTRDATAPTAALRKRQLAILRQMQSIGGRSWLRGINASMSASGPP
jgi:monofunctional biosynthetic peptidoglycan transglycosylase